jgi:predicted TPR repeat methyltransferase
MTDDERLKQAYALKTPDDSRKLYADWAESYDSDFVAANGYILHRNVADAFAEAGGRGPVLDMGAGTGICGEALAALGVEDIDGTDISPEMLDQAARKGVYRRLFPGDILAGLDVADESYAGIVSAGTFTLGHVGPDGLDEVVRLLAPGGLAVIAVRDAHYEAEGFDAKLSGLARRLDRVTGPRARIYAEGTRGEHAEDKALLLHLWKA